MAFSNTEFTRSLSGVSAVFVADLYNAAKLSGGGILTVVSGPAVLHGVFPALLSGSNVSLSGLAIRVNDATSGQAAVASGNQTLYDYNFGAHSGLLTGGTSERAPIVTNIDTICRSGLVVQGATGHQVTVYFNTPN